MNKRMTYSRISRRAALAGMAMLALLASCSQDEVQEQFTPTPISFTAEGLQASATTRATVDGTWKGVSNVAVQIDSEQTTLYSVTASSDDNYAKATLTTSDPLYWQSATESKTVSAWCPYNDSDNSKPAVAVRADQSLLADYQASDYIEVSNAKVSYSSTANPTLTFTHRTAKIVVNLIAGDDVESVEGATVKLLNVLTSAASGATTTSVTPYNNSIALLPPQTIAVGTNFIQVDLGDDNFYYAPTEAITLDAGTQYTYAITVKHDGLTVKTGDGISDWDSSSTGGLPDDTNSSAKAYTIIYK